MTNIEQKALALAREVSPDDKNRVCKEPTVYFALWEALCRAIEQREAYRQEVSDALLEFYGGYFNALGEPLNRFIIPPKPDPLVDALEEVWGDTHLSFTPEAGDFLRAALAKRGLEIREREQWNTSSALSSAGSGPPSVTSLDLTKE